MASKKLSKQQMRQDQFRSGLAELYFGALEYITDHSRNFAIGFAVTLLAIAGGIYAWQSHKAKGAESSYLFGQVLEAASAPVQTAGEKGNAQMLSFTTASAKNQAIEARLGSYEKVVGPADPKAIYYRAVVQAGSGKVTEAIQTVSPLTTDPSLGPLALSLRARFYESQGQQDKAETDWKALSSLKSASWTPADGYLALGDYYERQDLKDKAIGAYAQVEKLAGPDAEKDPLAVRAKAKVEELKGQA